MFLAKFKENSHHEKDHLVLWAVKVIEKGLMQLSHTLTRKSSQSL